MAKLVVHGRFEWNDEKNVYNQEVHKMDFKSAAQAFLDEKRIIAKDELHSHVEERLFCIGKVDGKIATVRFTMRGERIRIIGAGFWRKGAKLYEKENG